MAEFKKAIEKTLKPFARKVGSDIKGIESKVFAGKPINVVEFGIDNTGATDVTAKLNELFQKVHAEDYTEVIFPDGTYKISGPVNVMVPSDRKKYVYIHAQNRYKAKIEMHGTREQTAEGYSIYVGFQLQPETFEAATTRGYNVRFDGFIIEGHELPADGSNASPSQSIYGITSTLKTDLGDFDQYNYELYNLVCTNMEFINVSNTVSIQYSIFDARFENIHIIDSDSAFSFSSSKSNNNSFDNISIKNPITCSIDCKASIKNIDILYDKESLFKDSNQTISFAPYLLSNLSFKGFFNIDNSTIMSINTVGDCTISDIRLDLKPIINQEAIREGISFPSFISINSNSGTTNITDVSFEKFEENFANVFEIVPKFTYFSTTSPVLVNNVTETDHLKLFLEYSATTIYNSNGFYNINYHEQSESFKPRKFIGVDRNITNGEANFAALYLASANGTPLSDSTTDYSENDAALKGDIFTEINPEVNGHFAYVSTHINAERVGRTGTGTITSLTYDADSKLYTATFTELPKFDSGFMKGKYISVGAALKDYNSGANTNFEVVAVDENAKTLTLKPDIENEHGYIHPYTINTDHTNNSPVFINGFEIYPYKINRMKNMAYVTVPIIHSGATENRPTEHLVVGQMYFDTTLGAPVFWNGTQWIQGNNGGSVDTSNLATKAELAAIPAANVTQDDDHYFVSKYQNKKLQDLYNKGEMDTKFATKTDVTNAIAAIPAATPVDTSNFVTKQELDATLNAINEKLKQIHGGN